MRNKKRLCARPAILFTFMMINTQTFTLYFLQLQKQKFRNLQKKLTSQTHDKKIREATDS